MCGNRVRREGRRAGCSTTRGTPWRLRLAAPDMTTASPPRSITASGSVSCVVPPGEGRRHSRAEHKAAGCEGE